MKTKKSTMMLGLAAAMIIAMNASTVLAADDDIACSYTIKANYGLFS